MGLIKIQLNVSVLLILHDVFSTWLPLAVSWHSISEDNQHWVLFQDSYERMCPQINVCSCMLLAELHSKFAHLQTFQITNTEIFISRHFESCETCPHRSFFLIKMSRTGSNVQRVGRKPDSIWEIFLWLWAWPPRMVFNSIDSRLAHISILNLLIKGLRNQEKCATRL